MSRVSPATLFSVYRDNVLLETLSVNANDRLSLDAYGPGMIRLELVATDADNDGWNPYRDPTGAVVSDPSKTTQSVTLTVTNDASKVVTGGPYTLDEGELLKVSATGSDVDPGDTATLRYGWDLNGDDDFTDATGPSPSISWQQLVAAGIDDDGVHSIRVQATDSLGETGLGTATIRVINSPPQIEAIDAPSSIMENSTLTVTGRFDDPSPAVTKTFDASDGAKLNGKMIPVVDPNAPTKTDGADSLPAAANHQHAATEVDFVTTTTFQYTPKPVVIDTNFNAKPNNAKLNGGAFIQNSTNKYLSLTIAKDSQKGSMVVSPGLRKIREFSATFRAWVGGGDGADGFSFGYAPLYTASVFVERGTSSGLWFVFDTFGGGEGIQIVFNNQIIASYDVSKSRIRTAFWEDVSLGVTSSGDAYLRHPALRYFDWWDWRWRYFTLDAKIPNFNPQANWRFGMGARTGALNDRHLVDDLRIVDNNPQTLSYSFTETTRNGYRLPSFDTSRGTFEGATVTVDPEPADTFSVDVGTFEHFHTLDLDVGNFGFSASLSDAGFEGADHTHTVGFGPASAHYSDPNELISLFGE